jgi:glycosyltransferase involved in cell wall biosynthesis
MHSDNPMTELFLRTFLGTNAERHSLLKEALDKVPKLALERLLKEPSTSTLGELILALILHSAPVFLAYGQKAEEKGDVRESNLVLLKPAFEFSTPFYEEFKLRVPTLITLLDLLRNYSRVHIAKPGPLDIMAFGIAKALGLSTTFAFHTDLPIYAYAYTGSRELMDISYKLITLLRNACERVFMPSEAYKKLLREKGVKEEKIKVFKRGVDTSLFNPSKK